MEEGKRNSNYTLAELCKRLRDADNFNYQDACMAANAIEGLQHDIVETANWQEQGCILTDKELCSAIITCVMSGKQVDRDSSMRAIQRHILRVEQERDDREAECKTHSEWRALAENLLSQVYEMRDDRWTDNLKKTVGDHLHRMHGSNTEYYP